MTEKKQTTDKEQELLEQTEKQTQLQEEDLDNSPLISLQPVTHQEENRAHY